MHIILKALAITAIAFALGYVLDVGLDKVEVNQCLKWQAEAKEYRQGSRDLYYITEWQFDQCKAHNISINAPIR